FGCDSTVTFPGGVVIMYTPAPVIAGTDSACHNKIYTYLAANIANDSYSWSVTNGTIISGQGTNSIDILWGAAGTGTVTLTQISPFGCDSTVSTGGVVIMYTPAPVIAGANSACHNKIYTYSTTNIANDSYSWSVTNGTIISGQGTNSIDILWGTVGTGTVTLTQTSPFGCDSTVSTGGVVIMYTPAPVIAGADSACHNKIYTYSTPAIANDSYSWSVTNGTIISGQGTNSIDILWGAAGTGTVTLTQTSPFGCDSTVSLSVIRILYTPAPVLTGEDSACHNKLFTYSTPAVTGDTYNWSVTNGTIVSGQGTNSIAIQWGAAGAGLVTLTQTSPQGCDSTISESIIVQPTPDPQIIGNDTVCHNKIEFYSITPGIGGDSYQWSVTNGSILTGQGTSGISILWGTAGAGSVSIRHTNAGGCDSSKTLTILIQPTPVPVIQGGSNICSDKVVFYSVTSSAGSTYNWAVTGGTIISKPDSSAIYIRWDGPGAGSVTVTQTNSSGCDSTVSLPVTIRQSPIPVVTGPDSVCNLNQYIYGVPAQPGYSYEWTVTGGTIQGAANTFQANVLWNVVGLNTIRLKVTSNQGCDSTVDIKVRVFDLPTPDIKGNGKACSNSRDNQFRDNRFATDTSGRFKYLWSLSGGGTITTPVTNSNILIDWLAPGNYNVTLTITDTISGCVATSNFNVEVDSMEIPEIITNGVQGCYPFEVTFREKQNRDDFSYQWFIDGLGNTNKKEPTIIYKNPGTYNARVIVTNHVGCVDTATLQIVVHPRPVANFSISKGGELSIEDTAYFTNLTTGATDYTWEFHDNSFDYNTHTSKDYPLPGVFPVKLIAVNEFNCDDTITRYVKVRVSPKIFVPTSFTPNGDGFNQYFTISTYFVKEMKLIIFNRWGEILFKTEDVNFKWDGMYKGIPVQQDVYSYYIIARGFNNEMLSLTGTITLLR
ncbi:MAG TPA: PKD domain-containing protein, partial [Bacteroidia bacterium]|nr:PKD domain-containing protein [Bacteroidia bacterium]